eukprot:scaffold586_cov155-Amphora_coffeaeformis.AAC.24
MKSTQKEQNTTPSIASVHRKNGNTVHILAALARNQLKHAQVEERPPRYPIFLSHGYLLQSSIPVSLTQTEKRATRDHKSKYIQQVREAVDQHNTVYLFNYENMRSNKFKDVRVEFRDDSRIFLGKNKLLQIALGRTPEEEYSDNLRHLAKGITGGSVGLLITSKPANVVEGYFETLSEPDFARAGARANAEVTITEDKMSSFPVSMMEQLRKLGMPVEIKQGKVVFRDGLQKHRLCKKDEVISAEQCKLLKHFGIKLVNFEVKLLCRWSDGDFEKLNEMDES